MHVSSGVDKVHSSIWSRGKVFPLCLDAMQVYCRLSLPYVVIVIHFTYILFVYLGGLDIVCNAIVAGQATSLDHTSHGLLSVMQELTSRANRSELSRGLTAIGENDWTKRMINFAPYGKFLHFFF